MLSLRTVLAIVVTCISIAAAEVFTLSVSLPGSTLDGQVVNAAGEEFFLGLSGPATYCPEVVQPNCPPVTGTVFAGMGALWVEVPGGQAIYVTVEGSLGFTQAHSAYIPNGSYQTGFSNVTIVSDCSAPYSVISWIAPGATTGGILACPNVPPYENGTATYQIYAKTPAFNQTNCVPVDGLLPHYQAGQAYGAWQYT